MIDSSRYEIRIVGSGGQGVVLASIILAEAAGHFEGLYAAQTQNYGPEARGGYSMAEVVLSREPILYPFVIAPDLLVALNQEGLNRHKGEVKEAGITVVDSSNVLHVPEGRVIPVPITEIAIRETGRQMAANMVTLGVISKLTKYVSKASLEKAIRERVPKGTEEVNLRAFEAGYKAVKKVQLSKLPQPPSEEVFEDL